TLTSNSQKEKRKMAPPSRTDTRTALLALHHSSAPLTRNHIFPFTPHSPTPLPPIPITFIPGLSGATPLFFSHSVFIITPHNSSPNQIQSPESLPIQIYLASNITR
ncbi:hypothetical protein VIGAN_06126800, partial [Vigna angularis var. angularis]